MLAQENSTMTPKQAKPTAKVTQAQIREEQERREAAARGKSAEKPELVTHLSTPLEANVNR